MNESESETAAAVTVEERILEEPSHKQIIAPVKQPQIPNPEPIKAEPIPAPVVETYIQVRC